MLLPQLAQLQLQPRPLLGHLVEGFAGVGQLRLVGGLDAGQVAGHQRLGLGDAQPQRGVLRLQAAHLVDVDGQPVVEVAQLLLLLQPGDAGRRHGPAAGALLARGFHGDDRSDKRSGWRRAAGEGDGDEFQRKPGASSRRPT